VQFYFFIVLDSLADAFFYLHRFYRFHIHGNVLIIFSSIICTVNLSKSWSIMLVQVSIFSLLAFYMIISC
jgi:hypothetical protein